jgi:hypothetical protein
MAWEKAKPAGKSGGAKFTGAVPTSGNKGIPSGCPGKTWKQSKKGIDSPATAESSKAGVIKPGSGSKAPVND